MSGRFFFPAFLALFALQCRGGAAEAPNPSVSPEVLQEFPALFDDVQVKVSQCFQEFVANPVPFEIVEVSAHVLPVAQSMVWRIRVSCTVEGDPVEMVFFVFGHECKMIQYTRKIQHVEFARDFAAED